MALSSVSIGLIVFFVIAIILSIVIYVLVKKDNPKKPYVTPVPFKDGILTTDCMTFAGGLEDSTIDKQCKSLLGPSASYTSVLGHCQNKDDGCTITSRRYKCNVGEFLAAPGYDPKIFNPCSGFTIDQPGVPEGFVEIQTAAKL
jgi:hypothetical protein